MTTYKYITKAAEIDGGLSATRGGFRKTASVRPGGANPNDETVVINPPGVPRGGLMKTFHRLKENSTRLCGLTKACFDGLDGTFLDLK